MSSDPKVRSVFTENRTGNGKSEGIKETAGRNGQTIKSAYPMDNVHGYEVPDTTGGRMRGGPDNLSHSLKGSSAVQDGPGAAGPVKHTRLAKGH